MALESAAGTFDTGTGTGNIPVTGVGFQPKVVFFQCVIAGAPGSVAGASIGYGVAASSSARWTVGFDHNDGGGTSYSKGIGSNDACLELYEAAAGATRGVLDFVSMDADGFTVVPDTAFEADYEVNYLALGGSDLANVAVGTDEFGGFFDTSDSVSGLGFDPNLVHIAIHPNINGTGGVSDGQFSLGWSDATEEVSLALGAEHAAGTSNTISQLSTAHVGSDLSGASKGDDFNIDSLDTGGFTIGRETSSGLYVEYGYVALNVTNYDIGTQALQTSTGTFTISDIGAYEPSTLIMAASAPTTADEASPSDGIAAVYGWGVSSTARGSDAVFAEDGQTTSDTESRHDTTHILSYFEDRSDHTTLAEVDLDSFSSGQATLDQTNADSVQSLAIYVSLGPAAAGGGGGLSIPVAMHHYRRRRTA